MKLIYVAGRFRAKTPWDVEQNIRKAEALGLEVAKAGGMPVIPHANTRFFDGQLTGQFWIDGTAELLRACHALILVPGNWRGSVGTAGELRIAYEKGIRIFCEPEDNEALIETVPGLAAWAETRGSALEELAAFCAKP